MPPAGPRHPRSPLPWWPWLGALLLIGLGAVGRTETGQTIYEADETLPVELDTMAILRREGFRVVVSRTRNSSVVRLVPGDVANHELTVQGVHADVAARAECANDAHANVLIGIYFDSGAPDNAG